MKRNIMLLMGVAAMFLATGCCCLTGGCGRSSCCGYNPAPVYGGYGGGGCPNGNCGIGAPGASLPQQQFSMYGSSYDTVQAGIPQYNSTATISQAHPGQASPFYGGYASTAMVPRDPLPTF